MNILLLWSAAAERGYPTHGWMTFRQANDLGGRVRKGEKSTTVIYTKFKETEVEGQEKPKLVPMLKAYSVFNLAQLESLPATFYAPPEPWPEEARLDGLKRLVEASGIRVQYGAGRAVYYPGPDFIEMPSYGAFKSDDDFASTLGHELAHATGHPGRLNRKLNSKVFKENYAVEECIAELASAFLCAHLGFDYIAAQSPAYIEGWLKVLKQDTRAIFSIASYASQAADWLRERQHAVTGPEDPDEQARLAHQQAAE
jgi:antirestriction protein ArdC